MPLTYCWTSKVISFSTQHAHNIHLATEWDNDVSSSNVRASLAKQAVRLQMILQSDREGKQEPPAHSPNIRQVHRQI